MLRKFISTILSFLAIQLIFAQLPEKISTAYRKFTSDPQMKNGISSLLVTDAATGKTVYASNEQIGLAPASTLKVVTSSTALDVLGSNFVFRTPLLYTGLVTNGLYKGDIVVKGAGDPTTGSWRYAITKDFAQLGQIGSALNAAGVKQWEGNFLMDKGSFGTQATPGGWTFDDMGNYYGAGPQAFNWYENQYDLVLNPGNAVGQPVRITKTKPVAGAIDLVNELETGPAGSGDQTIIFPDNGGTIRGTAPAGAKDFVVSGSISDVPGYWQKSLNQYGTANGYPLLQQAKVVLAQGGVTTSGMKTLTTLESPGLDSIVYFFLQKSINLYGEALVKQLALKAGKDATTENGVKWMRDYWKQKGVDNGAMRIVDGSGLSPHNRVTTRTLVQVLQNARLQSWFPVFYEGLPTINGIKMKSGSISGVRGYTGYIKSSSGGEYIFAFLVNNFDGSSSAIMQKMFTVLDVMK
jgi:serine-type D-Ala-D-Ala carboxypeptidase/endopeptidase (penicillin-binding protein 4)